MRSAVLFIVLATLIGCPPPGSGGSRNSGGGGGGGGTSGGDSGQLSNRCATARFGASSAALRVQTFLGATARFTSATSELQASLFNLCRGVGGSLGMSEAELAGDMRATCDAVAAKVREEIRPYQEEPYTQTRLVTTPSRCVVTVDA